MQQNGELSVEEILESIKKVIARDNKVSAETLRYRRETEGVVLRGPGSTFGLTPMAETVNDDLDEEAAGQDLSDEYELEAEADAEVLDLGDAATVLDDDAGPGDLDVVSDHEAAPDATAGPLDLSDDSVSEVSEPLDLQETEEVPDAAYLTTTPDTSEEAPPAMSETPATPFEPALSSAETPIERMVRESLRPMLRDWLDTNLPPIVEQMVKTELERIMGKSH